MQFSQHSPRSRLAPVVKTIWRATGTRAEFSAPEPIVPDGCVELIFNLGDPFVGEDGLLQPRVLLAGQMTRAVVALPTGDVDLLGVRFHTARAGAALRVRTFELQDCLVEASSVIPTIDRVGDELRNLADDRRLEHLNHAIGLTTGNRCADVDHALNVIDRAHGNVSVESVARSVGISRRHLERRFNDEVGLGVKQMARIRRVHAALRLIDRHPLLSGAEIAAQCGYSDQAHLIRECKALTGQTPARLMTSNRSLAGLMREAAAGRSA
jgi:AraC-like DNA-binding protein